ncbi:MAG TPA: HNH endonuclease signature motif containing protein [Tissierellaceae bacterium]
MAKKAKKKPRKGVKRTRNLGTLTESEYFSKIRSSLRRAFRYWLPAMEALKLASRPYVGPNKLQKKEYQCAECKKWFKQTEVEVDHIIPVGSLKSYDDIVPFLKRLTPEDVSCFAVMCKPCHQIKTNKEKNARKNSID